MEAEPLSIITMDKVQSFMLKNIICSFGISRVMINNNGKQFDNYDFKDFCATYHTNHKITFVAHRHPNGRLK